MGNFNDIMHGTYISCSGFIYVFTLPLQTSFYNLYFTDGRGTWYKFEPHLLLKSEDRWQDAGRAISNIDFSPLCIFQMSPQCRFC